MARRWYAMRSKPRKEDILWRQLRARDIEVFYPRIKVQPVNPRARKVRPYFPGYMFIQTDLDEAGISTFKWMPHSIGLVTFGGEPAHVPDNLIHAIRQRIEEINKAGGELFDGLQKGVVSLGDVVYFLAVILFWLWVNRIVVESKREAG